jgi:hypothetical protein
MALYNLLMYEHFIVHLTCLKKLILSLYSRVPKIYFIITSFSIPLLDSAEDNQHPTKRRTKLFLFSSIFPDLVSYYQIFFLEIASIKATSIKNILKKAFIISSYFFTDLLKPQLFS